MAYPVAAVRPKTTSNLRLRYTVADPFVIMPQLGAELIGTNGNMETGNPPTGWSGISATITGAADERTGGAGVQSLNLANSAASFGRAVRAHTGGSGKWIKAIGWAKSGTSNIKARLAENGNAYVASATISGGAWTQFEITGRCTGTTNVQFELQNQSNVSGNASRGDDVSVKEITLASMFSVQKLSISYGICKAAITLLANNPAGVVMCMDDPANPLNFVIAYHDGTNVHLDKCVNGTYTSLVNAAATYGAGRNIILMRDKDTNTWRVKYGVSDAEAQIGTDQTISDASIINNTYHGSFSTSGQNTFARLDFAPI